MALSKPKSYTATLVDTSRYDGTTIEVRELTATIELPAAAEFLAAEADVLEGHAYRGPNTIFHLRVTQGGENKYVAAHLLPNFDRSVK